MKFISLRPLSQLMIYVHWSFFFFHFNTLLNSIVYRFTYFWDDIFLSPWIKNLQSKSDMYTIGSINISCSTLAGGLTLNRRSRLELWIWRKFCWKRHSRICVAECEYRKIKLKRERKRDFSQGKRNHNFINI